MLKETDIPPQMPCERLSKQQIQALSRILQWWTFPVLGDGGWREAQVTVGGVFTGEIDPTRCSLRKKGDLLGGRGLDVDGDCGGYNLQWAASSGILAGRVPPGNGEEKL